MSGRWPTNLLLSHSIYCTEACHVSCPVKELDEQSGTLRSGTGAMKKATSVGSQGNAYGKESRPVGTRWVEYGDEGGASRFFPIFSWTEEDFQ